MTSVSPRCPACQSVLSPQEQICPTCGRILASAPAPTSGQTLADGRYTVGCTLGYSSIGTYLLATDHETFDRPVVVKAMIDSFDQTNRQQIQAAQTRFLQEVQSLATLRHPAIPQVYASFRQGQQTYVVMEFVEGPSLAEGLTRHDLGGGQAVAGQPTPQQQVVAIGIALCRALEYLHSRQPPVVHHDIRPANIINDAHSSVVRLVGLGVARARLVPQADSGRLQRAAVYGAPGYAAPEQYHGTSEPPSDVYALAATLYHLASDDDPSTHPFSFPLLDRLGMLGDALHPALQQDPAARPDARRLRLRLERLLAPRIAPLEAPDGTFLHDKRALVNWCEGHWAAAESWLAADLPNQIAVWWGETKIAAVLRDGAHLHDHPALALDTALAYLDPKDFGLERPRIALSRREIDYGALPPDGTSSQLITVSNIGRRAAVVEMTSPNWIAVGWPNDSPVVPPGKQISANLRADASRTRTGGKQHGKIIVSVPASSHLIDAYVRLPHWGTLWQRHPGKLILIFLVLFCWLTLLADNTYRQWAMDAQRKAIAEAHYQAAQIALQQQRWEEARRELGRIPVDHNLPPQALNNLIRETYYQQGKAALQRKDWEAAREVLGLMAGYRDAHELFQQSFYDQAVAAFNRNNWTAARIAFGQIPAYRDADTLYEQSYEQELQLLGISRLNLNAQVGGVSEVIFSPNGKHVAFSKKSGEVKIHQSSDGKLLHTLNTRTGRITALAFSPDSQQIAAAIDERFVAVWNTSDGALVEEQPIESTDIAFKVDGELVVMKQRDEGGIVLFEDGAVLYLYRLDGTTIQSFQIESFATKFKLSPDGEILATDSPDTMIRLWRMSDGEQIRSFDQTAGTTNISFSHDGQLIASSGAGGLRVWQIDGTLVKEITTLHHNVIAWSPDNQFIATDTSSNTITIWSVADGTQIVQFPAHREPPTQVIWSADGRHLVSASTRGDVALWSIPSLSQQSTP